jgi:tRNA modification GTPase
LNKAKSNELFTNFVFHGKRDVSQQLMIDDATICAIATPRGNGAISILRLSGRDAYEIAARLVHFPSRAKDLKELPANTIHYASIVSGEEIIDEVLISLFRAPHSYTGEDLIEISCHGAIYIQQKILELLVKAGARLAGPGKWICPRRRRWLT